MPSDLVTATLRPGWRTEAGTQMAALEGIEFDFGKATIRPESRPVLDDVVAKLKKFPGLRVLIVGHTDNVGDPARNRTLSISRAREVRKYLIGRGVPADRLQAFGFGDTRPLKSNATEEGRRVNRRIAFRVLGG